MMSANELCEVLQEIERAADEKAREQLLAELVKRLTEYKQK